MEPGSTTTTAASQIASQGSTLNGFVDAYLDQESLRIDESTVAILTASTFLAGALDHLRESGMPVLESTRHMFAETLSGRYALASHNAQALLVDAERLSAKYVFLREARVLGEEAMRCWLDNQRLLLNDFGRLIRESVSLTMADLDVHGLLPSAPAIEKPLPAKRRLPCRRPSRWRSLLLLLLLAIAVSLLVALRPEVLESVRALFLSR